MGGDTEIVNLVSGSLAVEPAQARRGAVVRITSSVDNEVSSDPSVLSCGRAVSEPFETNRLLTQSVGFPGGVATAGTALLGWLNNGWRLLHTAAAAEELTWCARIAEAGDTGGCEELPTLRTLFVGFQPSLHLGARAASPNGRGVGSLASDYVEATVTYRINP